jgi:hypothetical protein
VIELEKINIVLGSVPGDTDNGESLEWVLDMFASSIEETSKRQWRLAGWSSHSGVV